MRPIQLVAMVMLVLAQTVDAGAQQVGLTWIGRSSATQRYREGIESYLRAHAPAIQLEVVPEVASADALADVFTRFEAEKAAAILLRSSGTTFLVGRSPRIPVFVAGGSHPQSLGVILHPEAPEGRITGTTYALPKRTLLEGFQTIVPGLRSIDLIVERGHPSSAVDQQETMAACQELGVTCTTIVAGSVDEAIQAVSSRRSQVSAFLGGNQALSLDGMAALVEAAGNVPVFTYQAAAVNNGALAALSADDKVLAELVAQQVIDVVINGRAIRDIPVATDLHPRLLLSMRTVNRLHLDIPLSILTTAQIIE